MDTHQHGHILRRGALGRASRSGERAKKRPAAEEKGVEKPEEAKGAAAPGV